MPPRRVLYYKLKQRHIVTFIAIVIIIFFFGQGFFTEAADTRPLWENICPILFTHIKTPAIFPHFVQVIFLALDCTFRVRAVAVLRLG